LLESLASLETTCREAVDCLNVLAWRSVGPDLAILRRCKKCSGHVNGGNRKAIDQMIV
jgi:hypothetical protein